MLIIFLEIKEIFHNEFFLAGRTVNSARMCEDFVPNFGDKNNWLLHHDNAPFQDSFSTRKIFTKNNITVVPHPFYFSLFPRFNIKLKDLHFDTAEVIEAKSQSVLNTLTEHDFQDAFTEWQKGWERCIYAEVCHYFHEVLLSPDHEAQYHILGL
jgi:hypothetical protein